MIGSMVQISREKYNGLNVGPFVNGRGAKVWGRRAHPIHCGCRREKNRAACQEPWQMQEEEIGEGEW